MVDPDLVGRIVGYVDGEKGVSRRTLTQRLGATSGAVDRALFFPGHAVVHAEWGEGVVLRVDGDSVIAQFGSVGYRTLSRALVEDRPLLDLLR